jgi:uncharacterized protein YndB with AHSA1/START domain
MEINRQAPLATHKQMFIPAPPEVVWQIQTDIDEWPQWQAGIDEARLEGPLAAGSTFQWKSGGLTVTSTIQEVEPQRRIGWTGKALGTRARHIWTFEGQDGGTLLATEESMEGWLVSVLKLFMPGFLEDSLDTWLQSLTLEAERRNGGGPQS